MTGVLRPITSYYLNHDDHYAWMATQGSGLLRWQDGTLTRVRVKDGLYDNRIYSILRDDQASLWLASSKGIFRVSERELNDFAAGKVRTVTSIPFSTGQLRFECQSGVQPASWRTRDGRLWFSTTSGLVVIDPAHLERTNVPPPVQITAVIVDGKQVEVGQKIELKQWQKNLEIRYAGLSFISPEKVAFRYILEGFDKTWTDAGSRREAFFTNLPPGTFRFRVQARNADGIRSVRDATVSFVVVPLFYQRPFFWLVVAVLLALGIYTGYRVRIRRLKRRFDLVLSERSRIARELHDTLLQGLAGVTMQLQALWTRLPRSHERDTLGDIIKDAGRCSSEARKSLWGLRVMDGESLGVAENLRRVAQQSTAGKPVTLVLDVDRISVDLLPEVEFQLLRIAQEAISNAIRHADARTLEIGLHEVEGELMLSVCDDGCGFLMDPEQVAFGHFGLVGMRERASEMGAVLTVGSAPQRGTSVVVKLPVSAAMTGKSNVAGPLQHQVQ